MQVEVTVTRSSVEKVEVEFPIYRHHEIDIDGYPSSDIWSRIDCRSTNPPRFTITDLTKRRTSWGDHVEYEMEHDIYTFNSRDSIDYALGRGEYACTEAEFQAAVDEAIGWMVKVFKGESGS